MNNSSRIKAQAPYYADIAAGIANAERNLLEIQPGFPATTPGSGSVGGGKNNISDRTGTTAANHVDNDIEDIAARDLARLYALIEKIIPNHRELRELRNLVVRWNYLTPGTVDPGLLERKAQATEHKSNLERWCASCARVHKMEPIGKQGRAGRCNWCYRFHLAEGVDPPTSILERHHRGQRISEADVKAALREEPQPQVHKPGDQKKPAKKQKKNYKPVTVLATQ